MRTRSMTGTSISTPGTEPFQPLLRAFDGFVAQQLGYRTK